MFGSYLVRQGERPPDAKMRYPVVDSSFLYIKASARIGMSQGRQNIVSAAPDLVNGHAEVGVALTEYWARVSKRRHAKNYTSINCDVRFNSGGSRVALVEDYMHWDTVVSCFPTNKFCLCLISRK